MGPLLCMLPLPTMPQPLLIMLRLLMLKRESLSHTLMSMPLLMTTPRLLSMLLRLLMLLVLLLDLTPLLSLMAVLGMSVTLLIITMVTLLMFPMRELLYTLMPQLMPPPLHLMLGRYKTDAIYLSI